MVAQVIGIDKTKVTLAANPAEFKLGTIGGYDDPLLGYQEFVYGKAAAAITGVGYLAGEQTGFTFTMLTTANSAEGTMGFGTRIGAAPAAMAMGDYGWFQVYGKGSVRTLASAAKGTRLNTTATAGVPDDDGTAASRSLLGIVLLTATGGAPALNADVMFSYPVAGPLL